MSDLPTGLHFYWYEANAGEEHRLCWAQLCGSMHRLMYVREELEATVELSDIDQALRRLAYHMENYLVRIYELRERAAKLMATCGRRRGSIGPLKGRDTRRNAVEELCVSQGTKDLYLELLAVLDDDIALRNQNTHETFLSLGYSTGDDVYDPHDALLDLQAMDGATFARFQGTIKEEIVRTVQRYHHTIDKIIDVTRGLLEHLDFVKSASGKT